MIPALRVKYPVVPLARPPARIFLFASKYSPVVNREAAIDVTLNVHTDGTFTFTGGGGGLGIPQYSGPFNQPFNWSSHPKPGENVGWDVLIEITNFVDGTYDDGSRPGSSWYDDPNIPQGWKPFTGALFQKIGVSADGGSGQSGYGSVSYDITLYFRRTAHPGKVYKGATASVEIEAEGGS